MIGCVGVCLFLSIVTPSGRLSSVWCCGGAFSAGISVALTGLFRTETMLCSGLVPERSMWLTRQQLLPDCVLLRVRHEVVCIMFGRVVHSLLRPVLQRLQI